jgi:REP element-mobilizing transposase RayT
LTVADRVRLELEYRRKIERALDHGFGDCVLRDESCAEIVAASLIHFDSTRYELFTWSVMPNHVHVVFTPCENWVISEIVKAWKGFTAKELNRVLGRSGKLWQEDYFDRSMRNEQQFRRAVDYVMNNPAAAGLRDWKFVASYPGRIANVV